MSSLVSPAALPAETQESAKRRQILDGAREVFLTLGFDGASMNDVARVAGVSKGTLYVYFASKEALFEAYVRDERRAQVEQICCFEDDAAEVAAALTAYARNYLTVLTRPESMAHMRTVLAIATRIPSIGAAFYDAGPRHGAANRARWLARRAARGELAVEDAQEAAGVFKALLMTEPFARALFLNEQPDAAAIEAQAKRAVHLFLQLFGPAARHGAPA